MPLSIRIVTPRGTALQRGGLHKIILRRREERFDQGSEVVVLPHHGEMMVRLPECTIGLVDTGGVRHVRVAGGFAEVRDGEVTVLTERAERASPA
jgi:F0F1-type ATP synthase epsilon subunit